MALLITRVEDRDPVGKSKLALRWIERYLLGCGIYALVGSLCLALLLVLGLPAFGPGVNRATSLPQIGVDCLPGCGGIFDLGGDCRVGVDVDRSLGVLGLMTL